MEARAWQKMWDTFSIDDGETFSDEEMDQLFEDFKKAEKRAVDFEGLWKARRIA